MKIAGIKNIFKEIPRPLWIAIILWTFLFTALGAYKLYNFQYRDFDLAYFTQVFWNTAQGRPFGLTIHPHLSLGDHAEWLILPLAAFFAIVPHPLTLLFLQALALALGAVPLYRLAERRLPRRWALGAAIGYLLLPFPANAVLFEFHLLPLALPLLLFAADAYDRRAFRSFIIFLVFALLAREDVSLAVLGFSAVALIEKRERRWPLTPLLLAAAALLLDWLVIKNFSVGGSYKFSVYYSWLGENPLALFSQLVSLPALEFLIGLLLPFLLLPLLNPRWLLLSVLPALGIILTGSGGGLLALQMHYAVLVLPGILLASLEGLNTLLFWKSRLFPWAPLQGKDRGVLAIVLSIALAFGLWTIGPLQGIIGLAFTEKTPKAAAARELIRQIPTNATVAASDGLLTALAKRRKIYALKYIYLGKTQYGAADYSLSEPPDYLALDSDEALVGAVSYPTLAWTQPLYQNGPSRLRKLLAGGKYGLVWQKGPYSLWQKGAGAGSISPVTGGGEERAAPIQVGNAKVHSLKKISDCGAAELCLALTSSLDKEPREDLAVLIVFKNARGKTLASEMRLLGDQLLPTHEWQVGEVRRISWRFLGKWAGEAASAEITFFRPRGALVMGPLRTSQLRVLAPGGKGVEIAIQ